MTILMGNRNYITAEETVTLPPEFHTIASKRIRELILRYCFTAIEQIKSSKYIFFPQIRIITPTTTHHDNDTIDVFVYKIDKTNKSIVPYKCAHLLKDHRYKFSFDDGSFTRQYTMNERPFYHISTELNEIIVKWRNAIDTNEEQSMHIALSKKFDWSISEQNMLSISANICRHTSSLIYFPIPISGFYDNIQKLQNYDENYKKEKYFMGTRFKHREYGQCYNGELSIETCKWRNHINHNSGDERDAADDDDTISNNGLIYMGNGQCGILDDITKTCLEYPFANLPYTNKSFNGNVNNDNDEDDNKKYWKCLPQFPYKREEMCSSNEIFNIDTTKCDKIDLCANKANDKYAIPHHMVHLFPHESYIECINGKTIIKDCAVQYRNGKLTMTKNRCVHPLCIHDTNKISFLWEENLNKDGIIKRFPSDAIICKDGLIHMASSDPVITNNGSSVSTAKRPLLRKVIERVNKTIDHKSDDTLNISLAESIIEYDLPTFTYVMNDELNVVSIKNVDTFRDAPQLFENERRIPVKRIVFDVQKNTQQAFVYIDDNLTTGVNEDLVVRYEAYK